MKISYSDMYTAAYGFAPHWTFCHHFENMTEEEQEQEMGRLFEIIWNPDLDKKDNEQHKQPQET